MILTRYLKRGVDTLETLAGSTVTISSTDYTAIAQPERFGTTVAVGGLEEQIDMRFTLDSSQFTTAPAPGTTLTYSGRTYRIAEVTTSEAAGTYELACISDDK
jgi:hypothetical protein